MRMPILSYFVVMGTALTLLLLLISSRLEPSDVTIETSQIVGVQLPFKAEPERSPYKITGTNFAAEYNPAPPAQTEGSKQGDRAAGLPQRERPSRMTEDRTGFTRNRVAENPHNELMSIH